MTSTWNCFSEWHSQVTSWNLSNTIIFAFWSSRWNRLLYLLSVQSPYDRFRILFCLQSFLGVVLIKYNFWFPEILKGGPYWPFFEFCWWNTLKIFVYALYFMKFGVQVLSKGYMNEVGSKNHHYYLKIRKSSYLYRKLLIS